MTVPSSDALSSTGAGAADPAPKPGLRRDGQFRVLAMSGSSLLLIALALAFSITRLFVPTVGHSWPMVFTAAAHGFVGVLLCLLWQRRGRWPLGWACLLVPSLLELGLFLEH